MRCLRIVLLLAVAGVAVTRDRIALIEFFGYQGLDVEAIRKALPVREGDAYSGAVKERVRAAVKRLTGRDATDVQGICCDEHGDRVLFIGLPGKSSRKFDLNPKPGGSIRLSREIVELYEKLYETEKAAVRAGGDAAREDTSLGYRLIKYPPARKLELEARQYALAHEDELRDVLENCSDAEQRAIAADALGYAERSSQQVAALVRACRDPDDDVRNNATRALGELLSAAPALAREIPAGVFVEMIGSGIWSDRNKGSFVLAELVKSNDPQLVAQVKSQAWAPLMEMARWRDTGHATEARMILGRIQGIPEERLMHIAFGTPEKFLDALGIQ
jgi:hypothetical protein